MPPAARITDMHICPMVNPGPVPHVGGPIIKGQFNVLTVNMPQARISDQCICVGPLDIIVKGSTTVLCGGLPAARMGDKTAHGGVIVTGAPTVLIGNGSNGGGGGGGGAGAAMPGNVAFSASNLQSKTMIAAHKEAKPFCAICEDGDSPATSAAKSKASRPPKGPSGNGAGGSDAKKNSATPSRTIINETHKNNEAVWTVDEDGTPISVEATLKSTSETPRSSAEKKLQQNAGGNSRLADDDGGHMIGHRFMSDQGAKNLFPQNANLNRSGYKKMENEWADWIEEGYEVKLKVDLIPPGSERPTDIISTYQVYDPKSGDLVFDRDHEFTNQSGEKFERVAKSDMKAYR